MTTRTTHALLPGRTHVKSAQFMCCVCDKKHTRNVHPTAPDTEQLPHSYVFFFLCNCLEKLVGQIAGYGSPATSFFFFSVVNYDQEIVVIENIFHAFSFNPAAIKIF